MPACTARSTSWSRRRGSSLPLVERYLRLGLQVGRHVEGIVDAYYGPPELAAAVDAEPPVDPRALVAEAEAQLGELEDGWLRDQVVGLRTYAGVLAGESSSYADEVEACYGVRPTRTDEAVFAAAHERLEELLPGDAPLAERYERWRNSSRAPEVVLDGEGGGALAAVMHEAGIDFDLAHARAVERALEPCAWTEVNAALMLHEDGATEPETHEYLERWGLLTPQLADHVIRFLKEPTSRTYIVTYPSGRALCRSYVAGEPDRFRRLLTEQVRASDLLAARVLKP